MKKKNKENYLILQKKLKGLEEKLFNIIEKLKMYGYKDSSENSDWTFYDEERLKCQSEINLLNSKMAGMSQDDDKTITYKILETGEEVTVRLTNGEVEADQGKISQTSPVGMALSNKKVGEIGEVITEQKRYKVQILRIEEK